MRHWTLNLCWKIFPVIFFMFQECYTKKYVTHNGSTWYDLGCINRSVCISPICKHILTCIYWNDISIIEISDSLEEHFKKGHTFSKNGSFPNTFKTTLKELIHFYPKLHFSVSIKQKQKKQTYRHSKIENLFRTLLKIWFSVILF